jgi:glycine/D-amino acid oxidase-like deaminating enzyme
MRVPGITASTRQPTGSAPPATAGYTPPGLSNRTKNRLMPILYYALGYGGNGVMYSAQAGRRMAQRFMYVWYYLNDEMF